MAPPSTKEQVSAALQQAGQYAGGSTVLTPENAQDVGLDPAQGYSNPKVGASEPPQGTWNPAPILKQVLETKVPGIPSLWQSQSKHEWKPPDPLVKEPAAKAGTKEWTPPDPLIKDKDQTAAQPQKHEEWQPPDPVIKEEPRAQQPPQSQLPSQFQTPQTPQPPVQPQRLPSATLPTPTGPVVPTDAETEQEAKAAEIQKHIKAGKTPGEAKAIVEGREPKTLSGKTPEPKPIQEPQQPQGESVNWADHGFQSFEQYQAFLDASGSGQKAVKGSGTTATLVPSDSSQSSQPSTPAHVETPQKVQGGNVKGTATSFGLNYDGSIDTQDNGIGAFGGVNTRNPKLKAVAVPVDILEVTFGHFAQRNAQGTYDLLDTPEARKAIQAIRSAHVEALGLDGKVHSFPIVDMQGSAKGHPGKVLDLTPAAGRELGFNDNHAVSYQIVGGDGKPYAIPADQLAGWNAGGDGGKGAPAGGPLAGQPLFSIPSGGAPPAPHRAEPQGPGFGGGGGGGGGGAPGGEAGGGGGGGGISLGSLLAGAALGRMSDGGGGARAAPQEPEPAEEEPAVKVPKLPYQSAMKQANVLGVKTVAPEAPGGGLPALGTKPLALPPPAPSGAPIQIDVVKGLMKRGFTRQQAEAFAAKASVSKTGAAAITQGASFRAPAPAAPAPSVPPGKPPIPPARGGAPAPSAPTPAPRPQAQLPPEEEGIRPRGSTIGVPNPSQISEDDPRVRKQRDGKIKGEHFVAGDAAHEELLNGLPGGQGGRQRQILAQAEEAIRDKTPMHVSYISSPKEAALYPTRESRRVQYEEHSPEARLMGTTEGQLVGHSFIPVSVGITPSRFQSTQRRLGTATPSSSIGQSPASLSEKTSEPHQGVVHGLSTNVLANNFAHINRKLAEMGHKSPYVTFGTKFINDLEGYLSNLNAGHTGTGHGYAVGTAEHPNAPDENHVPYHLTRREADFINTAINNTAAFAKHEDGQALRRLAEANGTLITPEGETNRLRHQIEQHEPGWRQNVLEPSIRSFKTGLIHDVHPTEEHMPATIRPGKEYQGVTGAIHRTSQRGRPDVGVATSPRSQPTATVRRDLAQNKQINEIEREFSADKITEEEARHRLVAIGENPEEYRFVGGSGGLITPYEDDPEALTPEEHTELKTNLRKKWIGGQMPIEDYRRKAAEVPLPSIRSRSAPKPAPIEQLPSPAVATKPKPPKPAIPAESEESEAPEEKPEPPVASEQAPTPVPKKAPAPVQPEEESSETEGPPAAPTAAFTPPKKSATFGSGIISQAQRSEKATTPKPIVAPQEEKVTTYKEMSPEEQETYVKGRVKDRLANQIQGAVKLRPVMEGGKYKRDDAGNPQWEKDNYDLVNSPVLGNKRLDRAKDQKFKDQQDIYSPDEHKHLNGIDRKRLSYLEEQSAVDTMADKIHDAYHKHMVNEPSVMAAKGWYTNMQQKLKKAFGPDAEIFAQLLGATSARTGVHQNFIQSLDAYDQLKNGNYANHIAKYHEAHEHLAKGEGALAKHMQDSGITQQMLDAGKLPKGAPKTDAAAMAAWIAHHDILPRQKNGQKFNANSNQVLKVLAQKWLQNVKAPKTPNFAGNLSGRTRESTIDVWAARFLHELGNEGNKKPWMLQPGGESGVRGLDFSFAQRAFRKAADRIGISPDDGQAIAWYHQKHLWDQRGHTKGQGAKKASFDQTFDRIFSPSGERLTDEEARKAFAGEKEEIPEEEEEAA